MSFDGLVLVWLGLAALIALVYSLLMSRWVAMRVARARRGERLFFGGLTLALASWLAFMSLGCGSSSSVPRPTSARALSSVAFVGSWSPDTQALASSAIGFHRSRFESRWGALGGVRVEVHAGDRLPSGAVGEALPEVSGFRIAAGADFSCAGATHEMHHLAHDPSVGHIDPRWPSWDAEDAEMCVAWRAR